MMNIALVTNWQDTCGIAVYGENLVKYATEEVFYHIIPPSSLDFALEEAKECELIHINFHEGLRFGFSVPDFLQKAQKPAILTNHTAEHTEPWYDMLDMVITHMHVENNMFKNNKVIHHGILDLELGSSSPNGLIMAQAGFPFRWKNYHKICLAANNLADMDVPGGVGVYFVIPNSYHGSAIDVIQECKTILNTKVGVEFETGWLPDEEIIQNLHDKASVMVYYTEEKREGPSGSVRMGIAAKRPVVVNGNAYQYKDIIDEKGIYSVFDETHLEDIILQAYNDSIYAEDLIKKDSFSEICNQYALLYKEILWGS